MKACTVKSDKQFKFFLALKKLAKQFGMTEEKAQEFADSAIKLATNLPK